MKFFTEAALPVCAIIVSHNRIEELRRCLASLRRLQPAVARVLVVDNGSTDGTADMVRAEHAWAELHPKHTNLGACISRNEAASFVSEPFLWFLDSDTEVMEPRAAAKLVALFDRKGTDAVGGEAMLDATGAIVGTKSLHLAPNAVVLGDRKGQPDGVSVCGVIASCNLMIRRATFERLGGFDPFYRFFYEDIDLTWRVAAAGGKLVTLAPMPVAHRYSEVARIEALWPESRNRMYFIVKNLAWWRLLVLPLLDVGTVCRPESLSRFIRRARQRGGAISLVTQPSLGDQSMNAVSVRRGLRLAGRMVAKLLLAYVALPVVLGPALAARWGWAPALRATQGRLLRYRMSSRVQSAG